VSRRAIWYLLLVSYVYILRTDSDTLYTGVTQYIAHRIETHKLGKGAEWTKAHHGARPVYSEPHLTLGSARRREIQVKRWSRAKKEALIGGNVAELKKLSRSKSAVRRQESRN